MGSRPLRGSLEAKLPGAPVLRHGEKAAFFPPLFFFLPLPQDAPLLPLRVSLPGQLGLDPEEP